MTTDNTTISRAALGKIVGALEKIADWDSHTTEYSINYGSNGVRDIYRNIASAALTEARAAMDAQGEAVDCAYYSSQGACCESGEPCKADRHNDALYTHPQATEPAQSSNPSGEHSEPSLLGSEPAPSTAGELTERAHTITKKD